MSDKPIQHLQQVAVPLVRFCNEQDGWPERELKRKFVQLFLKDSSVAAAYLANVAYGYESTTGVALCLRMQGGADQRMVENAGALFSSMFGSHEHLDILFLEPSEELELAKVCSPFFEAPTRS